MVAWTPRTLYCDPSKFLTSTVTCWNEIANKVGAKKEKCIVDIWIKFVFLLAHELLIKKKVCAKYVF